MTGFMKKLELLWGVPIFYREKDREGLKSSGIYPVDENPLVCSEELTDSLIGKSEGQQYPVVFKDENSVYFLCARGENGFFLSGPVCTEKLDYVQLHRFYKNYGIDAKERRHPARKSLFHILNFASMLSETTGGGDADAWEILRANELECEEETEKETGSEPLVSIIEGMERRTVDSFVEKAEKLDKELIRTEVRPVSLVKIERDKNGNGVVSSREKTDALAEKRMKKGDSVCIDFGDHYVGYVTVKLGHAGSPQDAPAFLRLKFAEIPGEILDDSSTYEGWISKGWIQEEFIHIDVLPCELKLPRRYAFRYLEICAIDTSQKFQVVVEDAVLTAVSAVSMDQVQPLSDLPADLQRIDRASLKTLQDCMQHVFEDGPKRDRRLWIGDLRLQAKANYATFKNYDLVKRCMYLFAGLTRGDGKIGACLFTEPVMQVDDTFLWDYSLFFAAILYDYYQETKDLETVRELWPAARDQFLLALDDMKDGVPDTSDNPMLAFIDWKDGLDRQAAAHGVWIYSLRRGECLARLAGDGEMEQRIGALLEDALDKAVSVFWDEKQGFFVSGKERQVSWSSQAWMVLADVFDREKNRELMLHLLEENPEMGVATPYAYHHVIEALLHVGEKEKALELMRTYWGGMIELGADTFWEAFDPNDTGASPYGNAQVNSFCHAWSCTPAWLLREYFR